jgi:hypothetical protein
MKIRLSIPSLLPRLRLAALLAPFALAACGGTGVGTGVGPTELKLTPFGGLNGDTSTKIFECIPSSIQAVLFFSNGSAGDFTGRVTWSTSNSGVAAVSNGDIPVNGLTNQFYAKGVLVPFGPGTATITANYDGLMASVIVNVGTPQSLTVKRIDNNFPVVPTNNATRLGVGTVQDFTVTALEDGVEKVVENPNSQIWQYDNPDNGVATVTNTSPATASGIVQGIATGGPLTLRAVFPSCTLTAATSISIANITAVSVQPEFTGNPNLIVGNTEKFFAYADFGNGPEQDISKQVTFDSSVVTALAFGSITGVSNLGTAVAAGGPSAVTATYTAGGTTITSPQINVVTVNDTLQSIAVTPKNGSVVASSDNLFQFNATGTYTSGATQDVTRGVTWSLDNALIGSISNATDSAGIAASAGPTIGTTTITATSATATVGITDTATLTTTSQ